MNRTRRSDLGAMAFAVAVVVGIACVSCSGSTAPAAIPSSDWEQRKAATHTRPLALFIGDSYTAGKSTSEMSYGCRAAVQMGWLCALSAMGGTGYVSGGVANRWVDPYEGNSKSFSERIPHLAAQYDPALVVLDGGRNDEFAPAEAVYNTMLSTIAQVHRTWPRAQIVFIRPRFLAKPYDALYSNAEFMARLKSEPAAQGVIFIDPLYSFSGTNTSGLILTDGIHPNREGEDRMTTALLDSLLAIYHGVSSP